MGYSYGINPATGRECLSCDGCGKVGGVSKRRCTQIVTTENGVQLPYCYPPALCADCFREEGGRKMHDVCKPFAEASNARYADMRAKLEAGDSQRAAAWGDWKENVDEGMVGFVACNVDGKQSWHQVTKATYEDIQAKDIRFLKDIEAEGHKLYAWKGGSRPTKQVVPQCNST